MDEKDDIVRHGTMEEAEMHGDGVLYGDGESVVDAQRESDGRPDHSAVDAEESASIGAEESPRNDADEGELATDRISMDALESLFTERTIDDEEETQEHIAAVEEEATSTIAAFEQEEHEEHDVDVRDPVDREPLLPELTAPSSEGSSSVQAPKLPRSPSRPSVPSRPPRAAPLAQSPTPPPASSVVVDHRHSTPPPPQLVSFDVGGRLFRCKASLIHKHPTKRLSHLISCACEQIDPTTFFIDRNPQHFEFILDWYRTGKSLLHPLAPHLNAAALEEDARYFDLYEELFPSPPKGQRVPPEPILPRLPERPSRQPTASSPTTPPAPSSPPKNSRPHREKPTPTPSKQSPVVRFSTREPRRVPVYGDSAPPVWFLVRSNEHLVVDSVRGDGKLHVRVTDVTGMARVFVESAVLFDSRSCFYLQDDGRAKLQHCVLPGNHVYAFWTEPLASDPAPISPPLSKPKGKAKAIPTPAANVETGMEVEFRLISTFNRTDEIDEDGDLAAALHAKGKSGWGETSTSEIVGNGDTQCLFLPPRPPPAIEREDKPNQGDLSQRDAIAEQMRVLAARDKAGKAPTATAAELATGDVIKSGSSTLKRGGAAIVQATKPGGNRGGEKVTVYQAVNVAASPCSALSGHKNGPKSPTTGYGAQQPRQFR